MASELLLEGPIGRVTLEDGKFCRLVVNGEKELNVQHYAQFMLAIASRVEGRVPIVIDRVNDYSASFDTLMLSRETVAEKICAVGYVTYRPATEKVTRHIVQTYSKELPIFIFHSYEEAREWALQAAKME